MLVFLCSFAMWVLIFVAVAYANDGDKVKLESPPGEDTPAIDIQKIKKLDLSDQQRKFIESLIESPEKK